MSAYVFIRANRAIAQEYFYHKNISVGLHGQEITVSIQYKQTKNVVVFGSETNFSHVEIVCVLIYLVVK